MVFERSFRHTRSVAMTPLIDVVFLLLIFFMLSTSFVRTESMELSLPSGIGEYFEKKKVVLVYVGNDGKLYIGNQHVSEGRLGRRIGQLLKDDPNRSILLLAADKVSVQKLVTVMDWIYLAGGKNVSVASWDPKTRSITR